MLSCIVRSNGIRRPVKGEGIGRMFGERGNGGTTGEGDKEEEVWSSEGGIGEIRLGGLEAEEEDATDGEEMGEYLGILPLEDEIWAILAHFLGVLARLTSERCPLSLDRCLRCSLNLIAANVIDALVVVHDKCVARFFASMIAFMPSAKPSRNFCVICSSSSSSGWYSKCRYGSRTVRPPAHQLSSYPLLAPALDKDEDCELSKCTPTRQ